MASVSRTASTAIREHLSHWFNIAANLAIERTSSGKLRLPPTAAHIEH